MGKLSDLLISFAKVFAALSSWLVVGFLAAGVIAVCLGAPLEFRKSRLTSTITSPFSSSMTRMRNKPSLFA